MKQSFLLPFLIPAAFAALAELAPKLNPATPDNPIIQPTGPKPDSKNYVAPSKPKYDYAEAIHLASLFFDIQRSGHIPKNERRLAWRGDSCMLCNVTVNGITKDLSGAWYEAANTMKWGLPLSWTIQVLATNINFFEQGFKDTNELNHALKVVRWGVDYLVQAHIDDNTFVGQLGLSGIGEDNDIDFAYYFGPEYYERYFKEQEYQHPALLITPNEPASDICAQSAAALASAALIFKKYNQEYADKLIYHAKAYQNFAEKYRGTYNTPANFKNPSAPWFAAANWYPSTSIDDDIALGNIFLYQYTNEKGYLDKAISYYNSASATLYSYSWDSQGPLLSTLLYEITKSNVYLNNFKHFADQALPGGSMKFTPYGLSFPGYWGTLALTFSTSNLMMRMSKVLGYNDPYSIKMFNFVTQQANYLLGDSGYTWMVGFGKGPYPERINHVSSFAPYDDTTNNHLTLKQQSEEFLVKLGKNKRICYGAIPSGPDENDRYQDDRRMFQYSEATQDANAPTVGVFAALVERYGGSNFKPFSDCTLDLGWGYPTTFTDRVRPQWPADDCYHTCNTGSVCSNKITAFDDLK